MVKYCIKRILLSLLILLGVSVILYCLVRLMPTDYLMEKAYNSVGSSGIDPEVRYKELLAYYGLDGTIFQGYWSWLKNFLKGDFGTSFVYNKPVEKVIFQNMGVSFAISFVSLILQVIIAVPLGIKCACNQYGKLDYTATVLTMVGISFPTFFLASIVIKVFAVDLGWFEVGGLHSNLLSTATDWERFWDMLWHLVLPLFVLVILSIGSWMRYTRTNTLEVLNADYIRTARAKGLSENKVVYKHVFRNTLIPLVTLFAGTLPSLFGGAMITETVFDIPGIGNIAYKAMLQGDIPFIMSYNMFIAMLTIVGILITDVMYAVVDPRVKHCDK
ncbi:MAG: ABC transporter permease, partial [Clostridiales bacterium]|nr:ABC transporter permease [Clostridiales bacterium]